jgi:hypothetical protein
MIDTIWLSTNEFTYNETQEAQRYRTHYIRIEDSHRATIEVFVRKQYADSWQERLEIRISSLPKLLYLTNLYGFHTPGEYEQAKRILETKLQQLGFDDFRIEDMKLRRVDLCHTFRFEQKVKDYVKFLHGLNPGRMAKTLFPAGVSFSSRDRRYAAYDKGAQLARISQRYRKYLYAMTEWNLDQMLRVEFQFRTPQAVSSGLHLETWEDLEQCALADFQNDPDGVGLMAKYGDLVRRMFGIKDKDIKRGAVEPRAENDDNQTLQNIMSQAKEKGGTRWLARFLADVGFAYLDNKYGQIYFSELEKLICEGSDRKQSAFIQYARVKGRLENEPLLTDEARRTLFEASKAKSSSERLARQFREQLLAQLALTNWAIWGRSADGINPWDPDLPGVGYHIRSMLRAKEQAEYLGENYRAFYEDGSPVPLEWLNATGRRDKQIIATKVPYDERYRPISELQDALSEAYHAHRQELENESED